MGCPTKLGFDLIRLTVHLASLPCAVLIRTWGLLRSLDYAVFPPKHFCTVVLILTEFVSNKLKGSKESMEGIVRGEQESYIVS